MTKCLYYDAGSGWTECEGTVDENLDKLREDGHTLIIEENNALTDLRVIVGECCGEEFFLIGPN